MKDIEKFRKNQREWKKKDREKNRIKYINRGREEYLRNKIKRRIEKLESIKKNNYKYEKTPEQRKIRYIKRKTRYCFPLEGHNCEFCGKIAKEHHHNTSPIEFDKFNYICHSCHIKQHRLLKGGKENE